MLQSHSAAGRLVTALAILAFAAASLTAEDVYVTSGLTGRINDCPPSCPYDLGTSDHSSYHSAVCSISRNWSKFGIATTATWKITPTLASSNGTYKVFVTKGRAGDCSPDIIVNMTTTGGALSDASGTAQTTVSTTAFQAANSVDSWTLVGYLANNTRQPDIFFTYASGAIGPTARFYMDAVYFQAVDTISTPTPSTWITQVIYGNPVTIAGTGPVNHPFALVSSTNLAKALDQWTAEQTNTTGTGTFTFSLTPGPASARFFRVVTQ